MRLQACQINAFAYSSLYNLRINKPAKEPQEPVLASANEASAADQNSEASVRERFAAEMERRMAAAPVEDKQGEVKDYQPLLDSLTSTIDGLEERLGAEAANAAMAMVLQSTAPGFSDITLGVGLSWVLKHVSTEYGSNQFDHFSDEWGSDLKELYSEAGREQVDRVYSIYYAMAKYYDYEVEFSSSGMNARVNLAGRGMRYFGSPEGTFLGTSGASNFHTSAIRDDLQPVIDFFRDELKSDIAASFVENMPDESIFEQDMTRVLSIIHSEQGMDGLRKAVGFLNDNLVDPINEKVAPNYHDDFGDRALFEKIKIWEPLPEYGKSSCQIRYIWRSIRKSDGGVEPEFISRDYDIDAPYHNFIDNTVNGSASTEAEPFTPHQTTSGALVNKEV